MESTPEERTYEIAKIVEWAEYHKVDNKVVIEALKIARAIKGLGYVIEYYYAYGACDIIEMYKAGVEEGKRIAKDLVKE